MQQADKDKIYTQTRTLSSLANGTRREGNSAKRSV